MDKLFYLLARCVEDVEEASLAVDYHLLPIAVLDRGVVLVHEVILDQLDGQRGLAHAPGCKCSQFTLTHFSSCSSNPATIQQELQ